MPLKCFPNLRGQRNSLWHAKPQRGRDVYNLFCICRRRRDQEILANTRNSYRIHHLVSVPLGRYLEVSRPEGQRRPKQHALPIIVLKKEIKTSVYNTCIIIY